ncbi:unnamed protein product [Parnassius apollo]|uniref:(apollo) hypothetical protein n=1 Tax=Parnassius apollo TaxID=110799 RepID=A0A8S3WLQ3_PARAO|nr:unnamed protein product [Parnassius apollo]
MAAILKQKDLFVTLKKETILNIGILNKLQPMTSEIHLLIFKENGLEKPTQTLFNHLSYYLVNIIDPQACASLPWPLYDTKNERAYRNELSNFVSDYSSKGLIAPVMSSYFVNPGCYKVTILIFQLSQLAVQCVLIPKMSEDPKKKLYSEVTDKYKALKDEDFIEYIENETHVMLLKFSNYLKKRQTLEKIAELFRNRISEMEAKLGATNSQKYINGLVDAYINKYNPNEIVKMELLKIKNVKESCEIFDMWLNETDRLMDTLESNWDELHTPLLNAATAALENSKALIGRHTGEIDRSLFTIEYSPQTDAICTKELQHLVNSEQKYILKNIEKNGYLNFPNLVRSFVIAVCFILRNNEIGDEIYKFNQYLDRGLQNYSELKSAMKIVNERVLNAESKLQVAQVSGSHSPSQEIIEIPPLPDLSNLKAHRDGQFLFDSFTPLSLTKHQFNLRRKLNPNFLKPQRRSLLMNHFTAPRDDFLKTLISCRVSTYDRSNNTQNIHNMSVISQAQKANETIAECSSGFTKQQILRLLSTKRSSSSKKFKYKTERPEIKVKKGGLFNESITSNESSGLFRSYSSPNLIENRETKPITTGRARKLSIMQEDSPNSIFEVSGIAALDKNSNFSTPQGGGGVENTKFDSSSQPIISMVKDSEKGVNNILDNIQVDLNKEIGDGSINSEISSYNDEKCLELQIPEIKVETPQTNAQLIRKTSSLEKIINRFKKVRANVLQSVSFESPKNIKTIVEEKENNFNTVNVDVFSENRTLLPDLISLSFNTLPKTTVTFVDSICLDIDDKQQPRRPRESLGTALGVDHTFLDQFDLID